MGSLRESLRRFDTNPTTLRDVSPSTRARCPCNDTQSSQRFSEVNSHSLYPISRHHSMCGGYHEGGSVTKTLYFLWQNNYPILVKVYVYYNGFSIGVLRVPCLRSTFFEGVLSVLTHSLLLLYQLFGKVSSLFWGFFSFSRKNLHWPLIESSHFLLCLLIIYPSYRFT